MDAKHRTVQLLGIVALVVGSLINLVIVRGFFLGRVADPWVIVNLPLDLALGCYLISVGLRGLRWADGKISSSVAKVKWGRVLIGGFIVNGAVTSIFIPEKNLLQPSNETQEVAMKATCIAIALLGSWLVVSGLFHKFKARIRSGERSEISS